MIISEDYLHKLVFSQGAWILPTATANAAIKCWLRFGNRSLIQGVAKTIPARLLTSEGLADIWQCAQDEPVPHRVPRLSFTAEVKHHYVNYDEESDSFYDDPSPRKKSRFVARGRAGASPSEPAKKERYDEYCSIIESMYTTFTAVTAISATDIHEVLRRANGARQNIYLFYLFTYLFRRAECERY